MKTGRKDRVARLARETRETKISLRINIDGSGSFKGEIPDEFLRHMVETLAKYAGSDVEMSATGDIKHHLVEDVAIVLGRGFREAIASVVYANSLTAASRRLAARVAGERGGAFLALATGTIRSVAKGVIGVAFIQAMLAGIGMFAIGVPGAGFWALLALILAIVQLPVVLLLLPMIFWALHAHNTLPAALFAGWAVVVGVSDNILKPLLLGRGVDVPMLVVFVGSIGGMLTGGITWLFIGPVVLAIGYTILTAWNQTLPEPGPTSPPPA